MSKQIRWDEIERQILVYSHALKTPDYQCIEGLLTELCSPHDQEVAAVRDDIGRQWTLHHKSEVATLTAEVERLTAERDKLRQQVKGLAAERDELQQERDRLVTALDTINTIRDSMIGAQQLNWSEHVYPLVAALDAAGYKGLDYPEARANFVGLFELARKHAEGERDHALERVKELEAERCTATRCYYRHQPVPGEEE